MPFHRLPAARAAAVMFWLDGEMITAPEGDMLATALGVAGHLHLRDSPRRAGPRGAFCFAGICQECAILVDGAIRQGCLTPIRAGMRVQRRGVL